MASLLDNGFNKLRKMPEKMPEKMYVAQAHNAPTNKSLKQNNTIPASLVTNAINPKSTPEKTLKTQNLTLSAKQSNVSAELEESSGQGDSETATDESIADAGISRRIETGLMAIAAHQSRPTLHQIHLRQDHKVKTIAQYKQEQQPKVMEASYSPQPSSGLWSVQIGAYSSRAASDQSIHNAMKHLPASYANARPLIAPLKTNDGWIFRARLAGFTRSEAMAACHYLKDCLPLAPQN